MSIPSHPHRRPKHELSRDARRAIKTRSARCAAADAFKDLHRSHPRFLSKECRMKPVYFFGTRAKELAKRLHPVTNTRCLDLWTDGAEHYYLRTMRACGNRWRLHSFLLLPDWRIKAKNNHAQKPHHLDSLCLHRSAP